MASALGYAYTLSGRAAGALPLEQAAREAAPRGTMAADSLRVAFPGEAYVPIGRLDEATS